LWGCYSVRDHLEPRAFVADLLLYDRLVVPVPTDKDRGRWVHLKWKPGRQQRLLEAAAPFVERVEWDDDLRGQFTTGSRLRSLQRRSTASAGMPPGLTVGS
jgi:hypothetical protein